MKIIKQFALENGETISSIGFFVLVAASFLLILVHALRMKRSTTDEISSIVLKNDTE